MLILRPTANPLDGTLDGENSGNPEVTSGSTKEFQCDLVPLDAAKSLNGKWKATVDPVGAATVTELEDGSSAKIGPPNSQGYQNQPSSFKVSCAFSTPEGTPIYTFERTVAVKRASPEILIGGAITRHSRGSERNIAGSADGARSRVGVDSPFPVMRALGETDISQKNAILNVTQRLNSHSIWVDAKPIRMRQST
ncbi:hypothetical protein T265_01021 [Opisthorchis viverrini]|uniref:Uncharacterized protein n=1 Tax=Opisthorchis viverrini TaxID=6198 RepID=A0A075AAT5_OPIVI|nr:hypothetical protein T265_01021 [Opisthorchis viverrini]KER32925.1 hypothetical protein T265_01021 [Opisthorchis viverrini]